MAAHPGPRGPGAQQRVPPSPDEDVPSTAGSLGLRGRGTTGGLGGTTTGTRTGRAVKQLLRPQPGASRQETFFGGKDQDIERTRTVFTPQEIARQQSVRSLRAGGPRGTGPGGIGTDPETALTTALGGTPKSGRTRGSVPTGGTAGGGTGGGTPTFAGPGNFRSGVLSTGLFLDTTGLSAIDKLNPRG